MDKIISIRQEPAICKSAAQTLKKGLFTLFACYRNVIAANVIPSGNSVLYADDTNKISDRSYTNTFLKAQQQIMLQCGWNLRESN